MTASWLDPDVLLFRHKPEPDPHPSIENLWEVVRVTQNAASVKASTRPNGSGSVTVAKFYPNSFLDRAGHLHTGNPVWRLVRTPLGYVNNLTVAIGVLIGVAGGAGMAYLGRPIIGLIFLGFMLFGARTQRRAFAYARVYGVWRGLCPNCKEPLNIVTATCKAKTIACSNCASYVMAKDGVFHIAPWYTQLF
jgi:hypothetical protein